MNYEYGSDRQLSSGAIEFLNKYKVSNEKRNIYVNFILQIYKCVPLLHCDYFSCSLFDKENICNQFVLKYDKKEGKPYPGDIISVTKINVSILTDGEHKLYTCEEIKLLEKGKKFLINLKDLKSISSKSKIESKSKYDNSDNSDITSNINNNNNSNSKKEKKLEERKENEKKRKEDLNIESNSNNNRYQEEITNSDYSINKITNINNTNNITNINNINIDKNNSKKREINNNNNQNSEKALKIKPLKKEDISKKEKEMILDKINIFLDDFQDGIEISEKSNNSKEIQNQPKENIDYSLLKNPSIKPIKRVKIKKQIKNIIEYKYISEINRIIFSYQNLHCDLNFKIKCRLVNFNLGTSIFYLGCPTCKKISKKICCEGNKQTLLYNFYAIMKDPSGMCKVYFNNEQGLKFMGMNAQKFKELLEDKTPVGQIIFSEYKKDFYENEYMISLAFPDDIINNNKKYEVINVERINKKHRYDIVNELKNILI